VVVSNVSATLDATTVKALNSYFSTRLFTKGLPIGTAKVNAAVTTLHCDSPPHPVGWTSTSLTTGPAPSRWGLPLVSAGERRSLKIV
jgi:hypothetical protein